MTEDSQSPTGSTESETLDEVMKRLLPTPTVSHPKAAPIPSDRELLIQRLLGLIQSPQPVVQERSQLTDMEIALQFGRGGGRSFFGVAGGMFFLCNVDP